MAGTPYLLDSNILLRWVKPDHNDYRLVVSAIEAILRRDGELCYTSQNVGEFWNTCTRPIDLPMSVGAIAMSTSTMIVALNAQLLRRLRIVRHETKVSH